MLCRMKCSWFVLNSRKKNFVVIIILIAANPKNPTLSFVCDIKSFFWQWNFWYCSFRIFLKKLLVKTYNWNTFLVLHRKIHKIDLRHLNLRSCPSSHASLRNRWDAILELALLQDFDKSKHTCEVVNKKTIPCYILLYLLTNILLNMSILHMHRKTITTYFCIISILSCFIIAVYCKRWFRRIGDDSGRSPLIWLKSLRKLLF